MKSWHSESLNAVYYQKWQNKAKKSTLNSIRPKIVKKITVSVESFGCAKCYSVSSPTPNQSSSNSTRDSFQEICTRTIYIKNWKKITFFKNSKILYINYKFFKDFPYHRKKTNRAVVHSWSNGLVVKTLDSQSRGPVLKSTGWLQGRLSFSSFRGR